MERKYNFEIPSVLKCQIQMCSCSWCPAAAAGGSSGSSVSLILTKLHVLYNIHLGFTVCLCSAYLKLLLPHSSLCKTMKSETQLYVRDLHTQTSALWPRSRSRPGCRVNCMFSCLRFPDLTYVDPSDPVWRFCHAWIHSAAAAAGLKRDISLIVLQHIPQFSVFAARRII